MQSAILIAVIGATLVALGIGVRMRFHHLAALRTLEFWIPLTIGFWPSAVLVGLKIAQIEASDNARIILTTAPLLALAAVQTIRFLTSRTLQSGIAAAGLAAVLTIVTIAAALSGQAWQFGLLTLAAIISVGLTHHDSPAAVTAGTMATVLALSLLAAAFAIIFPDDAVRENCAQNPTKCELLGTFVEIGSGGGSNAFGITLAMLSGVAVWRAGCAGGALVALGVIATILASGARLATVCTAAVVACALLVTCWGAKRLAWAGFSLAASASVATAVIPFPPEAFTERATLWAQARVMITENPLFGHGLSHWVRSSATQLPSYSPHNIWLDLLVAIGFLGTAIVVALVVIGILCAVPSQRVPILLLLTGVLTVGTFESTMMLYRIGPIPAGMLILVLLFTAAQKPDAWARLLRPRILRPRREGRRRRDETADTSFPE